MSTTADLEHKIAEGQKVLDFYTDELKKTNLPNYLKNEYEKTITSQTNKIRDLKEVLNNRKDRMTNLSLARPLSPIPYAENKIMSPKEFTDKFGLDNIDFNDSDMMPTNPKTPNSTNSWFDKYNPFSKKGGSSMAANNKKLLVAAKRGDINAVNELLSTTKNVNINVKDKAGNTPMMIAIQHSDSPMTHVLMSYHATVNNATIKKLNKNKSAFFRKRLMPAFKKYMKMTNKMGKMNKKTRKHRR